MTISSLQLQDYMQSLRREGDSRYIYWFEEVEISGSNVPELVQSHFEQNLAHKDVFADILSNLMIRHEEYDDWEEILLDIMPRFGLRTKQKEIVAMLTVMLESEDVQTIRIVPRGLTQYEMSDEESDVAEAFEENEDEFTQSWEELLFKLDDGRCFVFHCGKNS